MRSNPNISSTPRALGCKMTFERLQGLISGLVEFSCFSNPLPDRDKNPIILKQEIILYSTIDQFK